MLTSTVEPVYLYLTYTGLKWYRCKRMFFERLWRYSANSDIITTEHAEVDHLASLKEDQKSNAKTNRLAAFVSEAFDLSGVRAEAEAVLV
jgi:hypothetical protein